MANVNCIKEKIAKKVPTEKQNYLTYQTKAD